MRSQSRRPIYLIGPLRVFPRCLPQEVWSRPTTALAGRKLPPGKRRRVGLPKHSGRHASLMALLRDAFERATVRRLSPSRGERRVLSGFPSCVWRFQLLSWYECRVLSPPVGWTEAGSHFHRDYVSATVPSRCFSPSMVFAAVMLPHYYWI